MRSVSGERRFSFSGNVEGKEIGVYLLDGNYYALEDVCPHAYALLSQGFVDDGKVECPLHEALFDVRTGQCLREPGGRDLQTLSHPGGRQPNPDHLYRGGVIMQHITDFNPWLPDTQQVTPAREGGNGQIHQPGQFRNVIWQNRARVPDEFRNRPGGGAGNDLRSGRGRPGADRQRVESAPPVRSQRPTVE